VKGRYSDHPWKTPGGWVVLGGSLRSLGLSEGQTYLSDCQADGQW